MIENKDIDYLKIKISVWEKILDVQMHFNDLCLRIRSFAISILGVLLGSAAISYRFAGNIIICTYKTPTAIIFVSISIVVWICFYMMDRFWYHELLKGAVNHAEKIEKSITQEKIPEIELAKTIRAQSHESLKMNAASKLNLFYITILIIQLVAFFMLIANTVKIAD